MRLDFNVLWVDDQLQRVRTQAVPIARHMEDHGFNFSPTYCETVDQVRGKLASDIFNDEIDLIVVDWDLGKETHGQDAILAIREEIQYKDIIFYSGEADTDRLRGMAHEAGIEGVFCTTRLNLVNEVIDVFDSLVKKVLDLDHSRGIVMGATSDIDHLVKECLVLAHTKIEPDHQRALFAKALAHIAKHLADMQSQAESLKEAVEFDAFLRAHLVLGSFDRLRLLATILKLEVFSAINQSRASVIAYMETVVPHRNLLGHVEANKADGIVRVINAKGEAIGVEEARELRRKILTLRGDFRTLLDAIRAL